MHAHAADHMERSEDNLQASVLSFHRGNKLWLNARQQAPLPCAISPGPSLFHFQGPQVNVLSCLDPSGKAV